VRLSIKHNLNKNGGEIIHSLKNGEIVPNIGIGSIKLGMNASELKKIITEKSIKTLTECYILEYEDVNVWVDNETDCITQIMVFGKFNGKLLNEFGIGSLLSDIESQLNEKAVEEHYVYIFKNLKGICFEIEETEDDFNNDAKIAFISVFSD